MSPTPREVGDLKAATAQELGLSVAAVRLALAGMVLPDEAPTADLDGQRVRARGGVLASFRRKISMASAGSRYVEGGRWEALHGGLRRFFPLKRYDFFRSSCFYCTDEGNLSASWLQPQTSSIS